MREKYPEMAEYLRKIRVTIPVTRSSEINIKDFKSIL
jgi:hypothetical protein